MQQKEGLTINRIKEFREKYRKSKQEEEFKKKNVGQTDDFINKTWVTTTIIFIFLIILTWKEAIGFFVTIIAKSESHVAATILNFAFAIIITALCLNQISSVLKYRKIVKNYA